MFDVSQLLSFLPALKKKVSKAIFARTAAEAAPVKLGDLGLDAENLDIISSTRDAIVPAGKKQGSGIKGKPENG